MPMSPQVREALWELLKISEARQAAEAAEAAQKEAQVKPKKAA